MRLSNKSVKQLDFLSWLLVILGPRPSLASEARKLGSYYLFLKHIYPVVPHFGRKVTAGHFGSCNVYVVCKILLQ